MDDPCQDGVAYADPRCPLDVERQPTLLFGLVVPHAWASAPLALATSSGTGECGWASWCAYIPRQPLRSRSHAPWRASPRQQGRCASSPLRAILATAQIAHQHAGTARHDCRSWARVPLELAQDAIDAPPGQWWRRTGPRTSTQIDVMLAARSLPLVGGVVTTRLRGPRREVGFRARRGAPQRTRTRHAPVFNQIAGVG